jgi:hypothetical protein
VGNGNGNGQMALPPGATLIDPGSMKLPPGATLVGSSGAGGDVAPSSPPAQSDLMRLYQSVGAGIKQPFQATADELERLNRAAGRGELFKQIRQDFPPLTPNTPWYTLSAAPLVEALKQLSPISVVHDADGNVDWPSTIGTTTGKAAVMAAPALMGMPEGAPPESLSAGRYSAAGDKIAASLKPSAQSALDMPAIANRVLPALRESFADLGGDARSFEGREGTLLFKKTVQNAIDLTETRAKQVLRPIMQQQASPELLTKSPDLVDWIGEDPESITNQMVNEARKQANAQLTRGNYFLKPRSKQLAAPEATIDAFNVAAQARDVLYTQAEEATGVNLRPLRAMESNLISLSDAANSTHNFVSGKEAAFQSTGAVQRAIGGLKAAVAVKASPLSALSVGERPGLLSPLREFNGNMQDVFKGITPQPANTDMGIAQPPATPVVGSMVSAVSQRQ